MAVAGPPVSLYSPGTSLLQYTRLGPATTTGLLPSGLIWWGVTDPWVSQAVGLSTVADAATVTWCISYGNKASGETKTCPFKEE